MLLPFIRSLIGFTHAPQTYTVSHQNNLSKCLLFCLKDVPIARRLFNLPSICAVVNQINELCRPSCP